MTALFLGLYNFARGRQNRRLLPLLLLAGCRAMMSLVFFLAPNSTAVAALEVFSTLVLVWAMVDFTIRLPRRWHRFAQAGAVGGVILALLPLLPGWPIPFQIHNIIIIACGAPLVLASLGQVSWLHLVVLLTLALANLLNLAGVRQIGFDLTLLAYGLLLAVIHWEGLRLLHRKQQATEAVARQAVTLSEARQRVVEVSEIIGAVPEAAEMMTHVARTLAHVTHSDQPRCWCWTSTTPDAFGWRWFSARSAR